MATGAVVGIRPGSGVRLDGDFPGARPVDAPGDREREPPGTEDVGRVDLELARAVDRVKDHPVRPEVEVQAIHARHERHPAGLALEASLVKGLLRHLRRDHVGVEAEDGRAQAVLDIGPAEDIGEGLRRIEEDLDRQIVTHPDKRLAAPRPTTRTRRMQGRESLVRPGWSSSDSSALRTPLTFWL